jgi:WD40 repeat protein
MLYELLCGRTPFTGPQTAVLYHVIHEAPEPPRAINPDVPRDLETICLKAISKDPADRYRDCGELAEDLRRWLDNEPILARRLGLAERAVRLAQQNPAVASLVGLIFLLTAIALAVTTTLWQRKQAAYRELLETSQRVQDLAESNAAERVRAEAGELAARNAQKAAERLAAERQIALTEAKASAERAIKAEKLAVKAEEVAKAERKKTLDANEELEEMLKKIHQQKARLEQEVAQQRKELYFRNIVEAQKALEEYACYDAENYLDQCPAELRRWEWLYLKHRCFRPEPCHSYFGQGKPVGAVALSPDNQWMASGGTDGLVKIWSSGVPQPLRTLSRHKGPINALAFDQSEGRWLASAGNDKAVCLWDFSRDAPPRERPPLVRSAAITCLTSSPDGQLLATGGADRAVWILRVASPDEVLRLPTPEGQTACLAFSRDGKSLVGGTTGGILRSWSLAGARQRWAAEAHEGAITAVCFSIDGERIASGGADKTLRLWDAAGKPLHAFLGHTATVRGVAFTNDGQRLISGSRDATVRIWDATFRNPEGVSRRALLTLPGRTRDTTPGKKEEKDVTALAISRDGYRVITGSRDETVKVWSAAYDPEVLRFRAHEKPVQSLAYSPDGKRLATASADATIRLWDAADGKAIATLPGHRAFVSHVAFSPDGAQVASASADGTVRVWDATSHFSLREFSAGRGAALCVAFDPDPKRRRIAWGGADSIVRMSSLDGEATVHEFARHHGNVHAIAFSPDGKQLLSAGFDRKIRVWNTVSGQLAATVPPMEGVDAHDETIVTLSFRADGAKLFSGARDGSLRVWTPGKFQAPPSPIHRKRNVRGFAVHPEGTWVALGWDRTVLTLDGTTALVPPSNRGHAVKVLTVAYRGDGRRLASADELGIVKIWDVSRDRPTMTAEAAAPDGTAIVSPAAK